MSEGIRVLSKKGRSYYLPSKKELRQIFVDMGFLPPDAQELANTQFFAATPEGRLAAVYELFSLGNNGYTLFYHIGSVLIEEEGGDFYADNKIQDKLPLTGLPPRYAKTSNTVVLTAGLENLLATYAMTEKSFIWGVPHAGMAVRSSDVLSRLLKDAEIKKVVLAFPKSQQAYQKKLARLLRQDGFEVEELSYDGKSPFHHYQLSVNRMLQEAAMEYDSLIPDNGV